MVVWKPRQATIIKQMGCITSTARPIYVSDEWHRGRSMIRAIDVAMQLPLASVYPVDDSTYNPSDRRRMARNRIDCPACSLVLLRPATVFRCPCGQMLTHSLTRREMVIMIDQIVDGLLSQQSLQKKTNMLPSHVFHVSSTATENITCTVCMTEFIEGDMLLTMPCIHMFHKKCVDPWLRNHDNCPMCKTTINDGLNNMTQLINDHKST